MAPMNEWMLRDLLTFNKIELITGACLSEVTDKGAIITFFTYFYCCIFAKIV